MFSSFSDSIVLNAVVAFTETIKIDLTSLYLLLLLADTNVKTITNTLLSTLSSLILSSSLNGGTSVSIPTPLTLVVITLNVTCTEGALKGITLFSSSEGSSLSSIAAALAA